MNHKTIVFDIDGTICSQRDGDYENACPREEVIVIINKLAKDGHKIVIFTARGMGTFDGDIVKAELRWRSTTERQLAEWGVEYAGLGFGKPPADYYVDDRSIDLIKLYKELE